MEQKYTLSLVFVKKRYEYMVLKYKVLGTRSNSELQICDSALQTLNDHISLNNGRISKIQSSPEPSRPALFTPISRYALGPGKNPILCIFLLKDGNNQLTEVPPSRIITHGLIHSYFFCSQELLWSKS